MRLKAISFHAVNVRFAVVYAEFDLLRAGCGRNIVTKDVITIQPFSCRRPNQSFIPCRKPCVHQLVFFPQFPSFTTYSIVFFFLCRPHQCARGTISGRFRSLLLSPAMYRWPRESFNRRKCHGRGPSARSGTSPGRTRVKCSLHHAPHRPR